VSELIPDFNLAVLDLPEKVHARIERVRKDTIPKPKKLQQLYKLAQSNGVIAIEEQGLAIEYQGLAGLYTLEHSETKTVLGMVGFNSLRQKEYRVLWLLDGRTIETVQVGSTDSFIIYADGMEVGSFDILEQKKFFFFFNLACEWSIRIGDIEAIRMRLSHKSGVRIHLDFQNNQSVRTWIGETKQASAWDQLLRLLQRARFRKSSRPNTMWFLPRDEYDQPLCDTLEERLALMAFALLMRNAFIKISD